TALSRRASLYRHSGDRRASRGHRPGPWREARCLTVARGVRVSTGVFERALTFSLIGNDPWTWLMRTLVLFILCLGASACSRADSQRERRPVTDPITLAVVNARVWTGDRDAPWAEALAVSGERLVAVGTSDDVRRLATGVTPVDAGGRLVVPGFIDTHVHFLEGGLRLAALPLCGARRPGGVGSRGV